MKISKFINNVPKEDILHSNGLAKVASGSALGSGSVETFRGRERIDRSRQSVRRYGESMIGQGHMREVARPQLDASNPLRQSGRGISSRQQLNTRGVIRPNIPHRTFTEPPTRYNPYG